MNIKDYCIRTTGMIKEIIDVLDEMQIENFADELVNVRKENGRVFVMGIGRTGLVARSFAMRLMHIGYEVYIVMDTNTPAFRHGDLLLAFSGSGSTRTLIDIVDEVKTLNGRVAGISINEDSPLSRMSDAFIRIPVEVKSEKLHLEGSEYELALYILLDCISVELMFRLGCIDDISQIDEFVYRLHANLQ